jgi:hypothetical protein
MKLEKKNKSIRTQTYSHERISSISNIYYPLPFGPVKFVNKLDLIKKILRNSEEYNEAFMWEALGYFNKENSNSKKEKLDSNSQDNIFNSSTFTNPNYKMLNNIPLSEKKEIFKFMKKVFGNMKEKMTIFDVIFKDILSSDLTNKEFFQPYLDQHWSSILGKISMEHHNIKANGKNVRESQYGLFGS